MNITNIKYFCTTNGDGFRTAVFVAGCNMHCPGCFNKEAWDFHKGKNIYDYLDKILDSIDDECIDGLSILGGEPLDPLNQQGVFELIYHFRERFGSSKNIWLWTGYYINKIPQTPYTRSILNNIDYVVDGPYINSEYDINLRYRGSRNQSIYKKNDDNTYTKIE